MVISHCEVQQETGKYVVDHHTILFYSVFSQRSDFRNLSNFIQGSSSENVQRGSVLCAPVQSHWTCLKLVKSECTLLVSDVYLGARACFSTRKCEVAEGGCLVCCNLLFFFLSFLVQVKSELKYMRKK